LDLSQKGIFVAIKQTEKILVGHALPAPSFTLIRTCPDWKRANLGRKEPEKGLFFRRTRRSYEIKLSSSKMTCQNRPRRYFNQPSRK